MNKATIIIGGLVVALVLGLVLIFGTDGGDTTQPEPNDPDLSAVASPDIASPYFSYGNVRHWGAFDDVLSTGTTTVCALQSPAATSTLTFAGIKFDSATTSASLYIELAKNPTNSGTTTSLGTATLTDKKEDATILATDNEGGDVDGTHVFPPNNFFVVKVASTEGVDGYDNFAPTGACQATWVDMR